MPTDPIRCLSVLAAALFAFVPWAARAQGLPWQIGAGLSVTHDDNIFRAPAGQEVADRSITASLFGSADLRLGRQHLTGNLVLRDSRYADRDDLDNTGYNLALAWDGATVGDVTWRLAYLADRTLSSYASALDPALRVANLEDSHQLQARAQVGLVGQWAVSADASRRSIDYSAAAYESQAYTLTSFGAGVVRNPLGPLTLTVQPRTSEARYPDARINGIVAPLAFRRYDLDLLLRWVATGASTVTARLSATRQRYTEGAERDFDGATGQLSWRWVATGKTTLNLDLARDTGAETSFFNLGSASRPLRGVGDTGRLTSSLYAGVDHQVTGKIVLAASGRFVERQLTTGSRLVDLGLVLGDLNGTERIGSIRIGLSSAPTYRSAIGCDAGYEKRGTDTVLSTPYTARTLSCSAQLSLR